MRPGLESSSPVREGIPDGRQRLEDAPGNAPRRPLETLSGPAGMPGRLDRKPPDPRLENLYEIRPGRVRRTGRGRTQWGKYRLAADSVEVLRAVGMFGTIDRADLADFFTSAQRARHALADLCSHGLLRVERFRRGRRTVDALTLTRKGKRLLEQRVDPRERGDEEAQVYRAGKACPSQVLHDTAVYRAARKEWAGIEARGGRVERTRSDGDLQRLVERRAKQVRECGASEQRARSVAAADLGLTLMDGKLTLPDVRIEYRLPESSDGPGALDFVDVEVTTRDYRERDLAAKAAAGFRIHAMHSDGSLRPTPVDARAGISE